MLPPCSGSASGEPCMARLDGLAWRDGVTVMCHGARVGVRVNADGVLDGIDGYLPPGSKRAAAAIVDTLYSVVVGDADEGAHPCEYSLYVGPERLARAVELAEVLDALESDVHFRVAITARLRLFVHAGVVGWRGRAIVIPGHSTSGKTTLVSALVRAGATYYSDEFAVFDARGRVHAYAKPLYVRGTAGDRRQKVPARALGRRPGTTPLPVGLVVITGYRSGARWRPRVLSPGEGMLALLSHTVLARERPQLALGTLQEVVSSGAAVLKGRRGDAVEMAAALLDRLATDARPPSHGARGMLADIAG